MTTKKMLVAYDAKRPHTKSSDFLVPVFEDGRPVLFGLKSKRVASQALVVFTGRAVAVEDLFARLVDTGRAIDDVDTALEILAAYLQMIKDLGIGNIVELQVPADTTKPGFVLRKVAAAPPARGRGLP